MAPNIIKEKASNSDFEVDSRDGHLQSKLKTIRLIDGVRVGITVLALLFGITILGVSADALSVYKSTSVPSSYLLPLWPEEFDLRPTIALVIGATFVMVCNIASLASSKVPTLRNKVMVHTSVMFAAPLVGFIAALIAVIFFYSVNASPTSDSLLSWTCRWKTVTMMERPHFATLCKESWTGVYMSILLIPIEAAVLAVAGWQLKLEKHTSAYSNARRTPSPVMG